jgi:hypothetical protein
MVGPFRTPALMKEDVYRNSRIHLFRKFNFKMFLRSKLLCLSSSRGSFMIRFANIGLLVLLLCVPTLAIGAEKITGGTQSSQYTCKDEVGEKPTCTCSGYVDCTRLKKSGKCNEKLPKGGELIHLTCDKKGISCSCDWHSKKSINRRNKFKGAMSRGKAPSQLAPPGAPATTPAQRARDRYMGRQGFAPKAR